MVSKASILLSLLAGAVQAVPAGVPPPSKELEQRGWWPWGLQWDMPCDWTPNGFMGDVSFGSPKDNLRVFVDWTWVSLLVMTPRCWGEYNPSACLHPKQETFDPRKSSSFKNLSSEYQDRTWRPNHFFFEDPAHVTIGADKLQVGPVNSEIVAQLTDLTFDVGARGFPYPFQAIYGMSPVFNGDPSKSTHLRDCPALSNPPILPQRTTKPHSTNSGKPASGEPLLLALLTAMKSLKSVLAMETTQSRPLVEFATIS